MTIPLGLRLRRASVTTLFFWLFFFFAVPHIEICEEFRVRIRETRTNIQDLGA